MFASGLLAWAAAPDSSSAKAAPEVRSADTMTLTTQHFVILFTRNLYL
jgi:hypothetical protein